MNLSNRLFCVETIELLQRIPDQSIDMIFYAPPHDLLSLRREREHRFQEDSAERGHRFHQILAELEQHFQHCWRILRQTGNLFLEMGPLYNAYGQVLLNEIFGFDAFRTSIIVPNQAPFPALGLRNNYDQVLYYRKSKGAVYNQPRRPLTREELRRRFPKRDDRGDYRLESLIVQAHSDKSAFLWNGGMCQVL